MYLETGEFLAHQSEDIFWSYVDTVVNSLPNDDVNTLTLRQKYTHIMTIANSILPTTKIAILKFALSLREYSPTVAMFNQISAEKVIDLSLNVHKCLTFVELSRTPSMDSQFFCDLTSLQSQISTLIENSDQLIHPILYHVDHIHPSTSSNPITAVLYGYLPSPQFASFYNYLMKLAKGT